MGREFCVATQVEEFLHTTDLFENKVYRFNLKCELGVCRVECLLLMHLTHFKSECK